MGEPPGDFRGDLPEIGLGAGIGGALHFEIFAVVVMIFLQGFDQQIINRKPDRPAPVRIPSKEARRGFRRLVGDAVRISVHVNFVGVVLVKARKGAHAVRREEFRFIQHAAEYALELLAIHEGEQPAHAARGTLRHFNVFGHVRMVVDEPLHATLESGQAIDDLRLQRFHGEQRNQTHHRTDFQEMFLAIGELQDVVVKPIFVIP